MKSSDEQVAHVDEQGFAFLPEPRAMNLAGFLSEVNEYNAPLRVDIHIRRLKRPARIAHRDLPPIDCLPDDCLLAAWGARPAGGGA